MKKDTGVRKGELGLIYKPDQWQPEVFIPLKIAPNNYSSWKIGQQRLDPVMSRQLHSAYLSDKKTSGFTYLYSFGEVVFCTAHGTINYDDKKYYMVTVARIEAQQQEEKAEELYRQYLGDHNLPKAEAVRKKYWLQVEEPKEIKLKQVERGKELPRPRPPVRVVPEEHYLRRKRNSAAD